MTDDEAAVAAVLMRYEAADSASDAAAVAALHAPDGMLMAQNGPPCVGAAAVRSAYEGMFGAIALSIRFDVAEVRLMAPDWAFLRSTSTGTIVIEEAGTTVPESDQELFLSNKADGG